MASLTNSERWTIWKNNNPEKYQEYLSKQREKRKLTDYNKQWREKNPDKYKENTKKHNDSRKGTKYYSNWYQDNIEKIREKNRLYREKSKSRIKQGKVEKQSVIVKPSLHNSISILTIFNR